MRLSKFVVSAALVLSAVSTSAQTATRLQVATCAGAPAGTSVLLKTTKRHTNCNIQAIDAESITCAPGGDSVFQRTDVLSVKSAIVLAPGCLAPHLELVAAL
jgi:hypothetical protein